MTRNLREEVDIAPYVERGVIDVHDPAVRDNINTLLTGALGQCFITPYIALEKVRKVLAYYHIFLPKTTFLEGDRGVEVFKVNQFGEVTGMRNNGDVVTRVDGSQNLYFEYKMNDKGMYDIFCEIVTDEELDDLVDNVEDEINDEDVEDSREDKLDESSESVDMAGEETGPKPYPGGPQIGMAIFSAIMKKKKDELEEQNIQSVHPNPNVPDRSYAAFEKGNEYYKRTGKYPDEKVDPFFKIGTKRPGQTPPSDTVGQRSPNTPSTGPKEDPFKGIKPVPRDQVASLPQTPGWGDFTPPNAKSTDSNYQKLPLSPPRDSSSANPQNNYRTAEYNPERDGKGISIQNLPDTGKHNNIKPTNLPDRPTNIGTTPSPTNTGESPPISRHMQTAQRLGLQTNESVSYIRQLAEKHSNKKKVS